MMPHPKMFDAEAIRNGTDIVFRALATLLLAGMGVAGLCWWFLEK